MISVKDHIEYRLFDLKPYGHFSSLEECLELIQLIGEGRAARLNQVPLRVVVGPFDDELPVLVKPAELLRDGPDL